MINISGYSTGSIIKEHAQRKEFIDDFYANHPNTRRASVRAEIFGLQSARAVSLPDMLEDRPYSGYHRGREHRTSASQTGQARSSEDLLQL